VSTPTTRPHFGTIPNVQQLQLGLHPPVDPPSTLTTWRVLRNRQSINRGGLVQVFRAFEFELVFRNLQPGEQHDVICYSSRFNPFDDDAVAESVPNSWRDTGQQHIDYLNNTITFTIRGSDLWTVRLTNSINSGAGRTVSAYATKYDRSDA